MLADARKESSLGPNQRSKPTDMCSEELNDTKNANRLKFGTNFCKAN